MKQPIVFVLYDSITNSIFDSQIAEPLLELSTQDPLQTITIISFENDVHNGKLHDIVTNYPSITFIFFKKKRFMHKALLYPCVQKLHTVLNRFPSYTLIARGPIAGYICLRALPKTACFEFTLQARGILAEEYRFTHVNTKNPVKGAVHYFRTNQYAKLEQSMYGKKYSYTVPTTIEAVSPALQEYLIKNYNADSNMICIAQLDIPAQISLEQKNKWRKITRAELPITESTILYCYNGSLKPWQCPQETINFFKKEHTINLDSYLLILTQDKKEFEKLMQKNLIDPLTYTLLTVPHKEVYRYLAASDAGIIFREKNCINWTSRPTKILEYQAVGLPIIHNNTIAFLENSIY